ncbi:hypothetical protein FDP41_001777 [Naegleria fowleri]|uniref:GPI inositol-deacylase n=1 Tax=Naegleria fowleri TaxID=5763 RepID=A0A6A5BYM8_NAEFO|nr:uncharacterized protein FDP41_001777 [Naegleria fowleri]KAF0979434.1 hypothetical protein FDP41_001777 [Naegleria fowleri]CAG4709836.1 unnamed protein product [Naegleria fowleri]
MSQPITSPTPNATTRVRGCFRVSVQVLAWLLFVMIGLLSGRVLYYYYKENYSHHSTDEPYKCIMSWMRPNYISLPFTYYHHQDDDQTSAGRGPQNNNSSTRPPMYTLYRYVDDIDPMRNQKIAPNSKYYRGIPVLFVHGNSGSYKQVRGLGISIVEFLTGKEKHQLDHKIYFDLFYGSYLRENINKRSLKDFDVFAVNFNEQLSALSGDILVEQSKYVRGVLKYISSLYSDEHKPSEIIAIGHSMGGIVLKAAAALKSKDVLPVRTILTLSTPFQRHPILLDRDSDLFYQQLVRLPHSKIDIFSIGGGWHDELIRSDLTGNPLLYKNNSNFYHVMSTTSVPSVHCSTDHQAITWCKQIVLAISKFIIHYAAEGGANLSSNEKKAIFNRYFVDANAQLDFYSSPSRRLNVEKILNMTDGISTGSAVLKSGISLLNLKRMLQNEDSLTLASTSSRSDMMISLIEDKSSKTGQILLHENIDMLPYFKVVGKMNDIEDKSISKGAIKTKITFRKSQLEKFSYMLIDASQSTLAITHSSQKAATIEEPLTLQQLIFDYLNSRRVLLKNAMSYTSVNFPNLPTQFVYQVTFMNKCSNPSSLDTLVEINSHNAKESRIEQFPANAPATFKVKFFESSKTSSGFKIDLFRICSNADYEIEIRLDIPTTLIMFFRYHYSTTILSDVFSLILFTIAYIALNNFEMTFTHALNTTLLARGFIIVAIQLLNLHMFADPREVSYFSYHESELLYIVLSLFLAYFMLQLLNILFIFISYIIYLPSLMFEFLLKNKWVIFAFSFVICVAVTRYIHVGIGFVLTLLFMLGNIAVTRRHDTSTQQVMKYSYLMLHIIPTLIFLPSLVVWLKEWNESMQWMRKSTTTTEMASPYRALLDIILQSKPEARFANRVQPLLVVPCMIVFAAIFGASAMSNPNDSRRNYLLMALLEIAACIGTIYFRFGVYGYVLACSGAISVYIIVVTLLKRVSHSEQQQKEKSE